MTFYRPHERVTVEFTEPSMTKQSHKDECDIHRILKQYQRTGVMAHIAARQPSFQELPDNFDYQSALDISLKAQEAFGMLPSSLRDRYKNDPGTFLSAISDPREAEYLREMGVLKPLPEVPKEAPKEG